MQSWFMFFRHKTLMWNNMKFLYNTKHTRMFLKRKMLTRCLNIHHTILLLTLRRSTTFIQTHLQFVSRWTSGTSKIHWWKSQKMIYSTFQIPSWHFDSICQKEILFLSANVCWSSWTKLIHHQDLIPFTFDIKVVGSIKSC